MKIIYIIEGPDGSGKTTLAKKLAQHYGAEYKKFPSIYPQDFSKVGADFFISQMKQWVDEVIAEEKPRHWVIDRFFLSTLAYQGFRDDVLLDGKQMLATLIKHGYQPRFLLVSTELEVCAKRIMTRQSSDDLIDRMEFKDIISTLRGIYFKMAKIIKNKLYYPEADKKSWQYGYDKIHMGDMDWEAISLEYLWTSKELK